MNGPVDLKTMVFVIWAKQLMLKIRVTSVPIRGSGGARAGVGVDAALPVMP